MECHRRLGKWPSGLASLVGLTAAVTLVLRCAFWAAPRPLAGCRAESPLLVGPRPVNLSSTPPTLEEIGKRSASVLPGGLYHPPDCEAQHRVAVVVPYRKRAMHLRALLCHLHPFLQRQQIHYRIYVVEQWGDGTFNKGKLLNAGIREVLRDEDWSCIVIHDVDLLAENDRNLYTCDKCNPTHLAVAIDKFHYRCIPPGSLSMSGRTYATFPRCVGVIQLSWRTPQAIGLFFPSVFPQRCCGLQGLLKGRWSRYNLQRALDDFKLVALKGKAVGREVSTFPWSAMPMSIRAICSWCLCVCAC
ncbi:beta-1,4-galactosyltransferase 3-like isoform X2 [Syngnathus typhle]|uniref:beta-1,4-galactosyltransferase 3-like isoform X2 n=1 Tax=Syngnathus typhle TaxID=161592 RepID=UPI002A699560|nr:beta-1,4-galactosyltransferase 3-like isoform X2 [Syngnathus typhle]